MDKVYRQNYHDEKEKQKLISIFKSSVETFRCKTCGKWFPSFQALGGHRTVHNRPPCKTKRDLQLVKPVSVKSKKMKIAVHVCNICGIEFSVGQALGGHMRRHSKNQKNIIDVGKVVTEDNVVVDNSSSDNGLCLELRLSPPDLDVGLLKFSRGSLGFNLNSTNSD